MRARRSLVFESGLVGLTVFRAIRALWPEADYLYLAETACFPYGALNPDTLIARVNTVIGEAMAGFERAMSHPGCGSCPGDCAARGSGAGCQRDASEGSLEVSCTAGFQFEIIVQRFVAGEA